MSENLIKVTQETFSSVYINAIVMIGEIFNFIIYKKNIYIYEKNSDILNYSMSDTRIIKIKILAFLSCDDLALLLEMHKFNNMFFLLRIDSGIYKVNFNLINGNINIFDYGFTQPPTNSYFKFKDWEAEAYIRGKCIMSMKANLEGRFFKNTIGNIVRFPDLILKYLFDENSDISIIYNDNLYRNLFYGLFDNFFKITHFYLSNIYILVEKTGMNNRDLRQDFGKFSKTVNIFYIASINSDITNRLSDSFFNSKMEFLQYFSLFESNFSVEPGNRLECMLFVINAKFPLLRKKPVLLKLKSFMEIKFEFLKYNLNLKINLFF
jgi:hypothetical protein